MRLRIAALATFVLVAHCGVGKAGTIQDFIIVSAANPQVQHGTFDNGDLYLGNFSFDTSLVPATGPFSIPIASFDFVTLVPGGSNEASPAFGDFAVLTGTPVTIGGHTFSYDVLTVDSFFQEFDFVEPLGVFHGGAILYAFEADAGNGFADTKGTALAVDPEILVTPEPGAAFGTLGGLVLLGVIGGLGWARRISG